MRSLKLQEILKNPILYHAMNGNIIWQSLKITKENETSMEIQEQSIDQSLEESQKISQIPVTLQIKEQSQKVNDLFTLQNCSICGLNCNWAYLLKSNANYGLLAHNCFVCGRIVCRICAPAGDEIPGDGLNQINQLHDWKIVIPSKGLQPQRVCSHCYLDSYDLI